MATPTGTREYSYYVDGSVRNITDDHATASFRYDAFGQVAELDVTTGAPPFVPDSRHDSRFGDLLAWRDVGGAQARVLVRTIPGPDGFSATRRGAGGPWVFAFGELRGNRFFTDENGAFVQDVDYQPFGTPTSSGAQPGSLLYSTQQWNAGDALAAFGVSQLGARIYDPAIGRFLSRDPLLIPATATTTNPYAFANNDPINASDPTGLDVVDTEERPPLYTEDKAGIGEPSVIAGSGPGVIQDTGAIATHTQTSHGSHGSQHPGPGTIPSSTVLAAAPTLPPTTSAPTQPGLWNRPGEQPESLYIGWMAHALIAQAYKDAHPSELVYANHFPIATILTAFSGSQPGALNPSFAQLKPDIVNVVTGEIYEIKSMTQWQNASLELAMYLAVFRAANVPLIPGAPLAPGTFGVIPAPGGFFVYESPLPGLILYAYRPIPLPMPFRMAERSPVRAPTRAPVDEPGLWDKLSEATGLTGAALAAYLVVSEGSRIVFPPRNFIPVP